MGGGAISCHGLGEGWGLAMGLLEAIDERSYIVVCGAGTRSMYYIGLFQHLTRHPRWDSVFAKLRGCAGVSSGCVVALAIHVGADFSAIIDALVELSLRHNSIAPGLDVALALESFGLDDGTVLQLTIDTVLGAIGLSTATTFLSLHRLTGRDFRVCAVNMHTMRPAVFSHVTTPQMPLRDAIYMSMTVPFVFKPRRWVGELYVDGGLMDNYPTSVFGADVAPVMVHMTWVLNTPLTTLRAFACTIASSTIYVQLERLNHWKENHPGAVHALTDEEGEREGFLASDTEHLMAMRARGFAHGWMMCHRDDVLKIVTATAAYLARFERRTETEHDEGDPQLD